MTLRAYPEDIVQGCDRVRLSWEDIPKSIHYNCSHKDMPFQKKKKEKRHAISLIHLSLPQYLNLASRTCFKFH